MATNLNTIKNWFKTGLKPTQAQFWAWMDSYWHKDQTIPTNKIDGLENALNSKASNEQLAGKVDRGGYEGTAQDLADAIENIPEQVEELLSDAGNRTVKLVTDEDPYFLIQSDDNKFLTITTEFDPVLSLGFTANTEFWIKNTSPTPREVTFDTAIEFIGSPLIPTNGLAILKLIEVVDDVEYWSVNHLLANGTPSGSGASLQQVTDIGNETTNDIYSEGNIEGNKLIANQSLSVGDEGDSTYLKVFDDDFDGETKSFRFSSNKSAGNFQAYLNVFPADLLEISTYDGIENNEASISSIINPLSPGFSNGIRIRSRAGNIPTKGLIGDDFFDKQSDPNAFAQLGDLPFANIQTSSFTAVNLVAYSTNGTVTVTDPTPETNKGYIVLVVGGTTTIDGVGYTAGALVYRFYDGTVWSSVEYAKKSDLPITIIQNNIVTTDSTTPFLTRTIPIGKLNEIKKIKIDTQLITELDFPSAVIKLRNTIDDSEIEVFNYSLNSSLYAVIEKTIYINPDNSIVVNPEVHLDFQLNNGVGSNSIIPFLPNEAYELELYILAGAGDVIYNIGMSVIVYK